MGSGHNSPMNLDTDQCYQAILTHDARFDGVFFVGISTTRIYCRTVCTALTPRPDRCTFHPSAAAAERAGFRPCLRCRPELAPGLSRFDSGDQLAGEAAAQTEADAQTQRLLLAKRLLTDTDLPIGEVAFASGFSSLRRFNALFQERYRLNPTALRRSRLSGPPETLSCEVACRPPLVLDALLAFLVSRAAPGFEALDGCRYLRTVRLGEGRGWVMVEPMPERPTLRVTLSASLAPVLRPALACVRHLFDLRADPLTIAAHLGPLADAHPGLRVPGAFDGFEMAVRAILGQQVSVQAASTLAPRFASAQGEPLLTPFASLTHLPPTPDQVAAARPEDLIALGVLPTRAHSILALDRAVRRPARPGLAGRLPAHRPRHSEGFRRRPAEASFRNSRVLASVAVLRGHAPLEVAGKAIPARMIYTQYQETTQ